MCKGKLRSVLIGALSAGLAISALAVVDAGQVGAQTSTTNSAPPDLVWGAAPVDTGQDGVRTSTPSSASQDPVWAAAPIDAAGQSGIWWGSAPTGVA